MSVVSGEGAELVELFDCIVDGLFRRQMKGHLFREA